MDYTKIDHATTPKAEEMLAKLIQQDDMLSHAGEHELSRCVPGIRELSAVAMADTHLGSETPVYTGLAAFPWFQNGKPMGAFGYSLCQFFIYRDGTGVYWCREWKWGRQSMVPNKNHFGPEIQFRNGRGLNKMVVRHYAFGCKHNYRNATSAEIDAHNARPLYSHDHAYICPKCGDFYVVDSSD